jgi:hypothetical protein
MELVNHCCDVHDIVNKSILDIEEAVILEVFTFHYSCKLDMFHLSVGLFNQRKQMITVLHPTLTSDWMSYRSVKVSCRTDNSYGQLQLSQSFVRVIASDVHVFVCNMESKCRNKLVPAPAFFALQVGLHTIMVSNSVLDIKMAALRIFMWDHH